MKTDETVKQVCIDMCAEEILSERGIVEYSNRFLAAHDLEIGAKDAEIRKLQTEIECLRAALYPVLTIPVSANDDPLQAVRKCSGAVTTALRIYREGYLTKKGTGEI